MFMTVCKNFLFVLIFLLTAPIVQNSHILAVIYFIFLKNVQDKIEKLFHTEFGPHWKDR